MFFLIGLLLSKQIYNYNVLREIYLNIKQIVLNFNLLKIIKRIESKYILIFYL